MSDQNLVWSDILANEIIRTGGINFFKLHGLTSLIMPRTKGSPTVYRTKEVPQGIGQRKVPQAIGQRKCHRLNNVLQCVPYDSNLHRLDLFTSTHVHFPRQTTSSPQIKKTLTFELTLTKQH